MKTASKRICLLALFLALTSCASGRINLVKTGQVSMDVVAVKSVTVLDADVYQDGDKLIVEGRVKSKQYGYVDITIVGPDSKIIDQARSYYIPRMTARGFARYGDFEDVFHIVPPKGSAVQLAFH
jgi:hypothetical protein